MVNPSVEDEEKVEEEEEVEEEEVEEEEEEYVDFQDQVDQAVDSEKLRKAAILGLSDGSVWGATPGFNIAEKGVQIKEMFVDKPNNIPPTFTVDDVEYSFLNTDIRSIKFRHDRNCNPCGCILVKTKRTIVVGIFDERIVPVHGIIATDQLANYLLGMNY